MILKFVIIDTSGVLQPSTDVFDSLSDAESYVTNRWSGLPSNQKVEGNKWYIFPVWEANQEVS